MVVATLPHLPRPRWLADRPRVRGFLGQFALVVAGIVLYFSVRGLTESRADVAVRHADRVWDIEQALSLSWERSLQAMVLGHGWVVTAANWVYIWGHWPVIAAVLPWLYLRHPHDYRLLRDSMALSGAVGLLVFATFPVAPPRLGPFGLVDTVTEQSHAYRVLQPPSFVNQYAAVPSLHVGWDLLVGLFVLRCATHWLLRVAGAVMPVAMTAAVVVTANHYVLDAILGAALSLGALLVVVEVRRARHRREAPA
jgi:hypothetical protein